MTHVVFVANGRCFELLIHFLGHFSAHVDDPCEFLGWEVTIRKRVKLCYNIFMIL